MDYLGNAMQTKTDNELVIGYAEGGNEAAFAELITRYQAMIFRTCFRMLGNVQDAEDARQAVFIVLARKAGSLRREGDLGGWLHRVARNVALQALDRREAQRKRQEELAMTQETVVEADQAPDTAAVLRQMDTALDGLSAILRQAVILRYLRGFSEQEAAAHAGCPVGTMKWRTSNGLAKLRQRLANRGVELSGVALAGLLTSEASAAVPETLLPSILSTVKSAAATTAAATTATSTAGMLAKGAMKAMFIAKVKMVAAVTAASLVVAGSGVLVAQEAAQRKAAEQPPAAVAQSATSIKPVAAQPAVISDLPKTTDLEKKLKSIDIPGWHITEERLAIAVAKLVDAIATNDPQHARVVIVLDPPTPSPRLQQFLSLTMDCRGERGREVTITALEILEAMAEMSGQKIAFETDRVVLSPKQPDKTTVVIPEISFKDAPVQEIITKLQTLSGVPIRLERTNDLPLITLQAKNIQLDLAVLTVASKAGLAMGYEKDGLGLVLK